MKPGIETSLRRERDARGLTQAQMAELGGISRQSYAAVESGRSVPSTEIALRLADALGTSVESLFRLAERRPATVEAEAVGPVAGGRVPVRLARVGGRRIAIPIRAGGAGSGFTAGDGVAVGVAEERVQIELFADRPPPADLVVAGCDPSFPLVADHLRRSAGFETISIQRGSRAALDALAKGHVHIAGIHLLDPATGEYNEPWIRRFVPFPAVRIRFATWEQGLLVRPDAPVRIERPGDLARPGVRFLNRERGSGTRSLLDRWLEEEGVPAAGIAGYESTAAAGHLSVAEAVWSGLADAGVAIRAAGSAYGLEVVPLAREAYDLVVPRHFLDLPVVQALLDVLRTRALRMQVGAFPGYDVEGMGEPLGTTSPDRGSR